MVVLQVIDIDNLQLGNLMNGTLVFAKEDIELLNTMSDIFHFVSEQTQKVAYNNKIPEFLLDHKAKEEHVDFYDSSLSVDVKRKLIDQSAYLHEKKGSYIAIKTVLEIVGMRAEVLPWHQYGGEPHHFKIETLHGDFIKSGSRRLAQLIEAYKNESSVFEGVDIFLMDALIRHIDETYHYLIKFLECGEFFGTADFTQRDAPNSKFTDQTYAYDVIFEEAHTVHIQDYLVSTQQLNETYIYDVNFNECGELALPDATLMTIPHQSVLQSSYYHYVAPYDTCGEFYCEG